ncbi:MAG: hypothetical protein QXH44_09500 [Pyrobaculum sp.]
MMVRLFRRIIIIFIVSFTISYAFFSLISMEDSNLATVAVLSWLAIIILVSVFSALRTKQNVVIPYEILFVILIPMLYTWCKYIWFSSITYDNFFAYTRLESYLRAYQSAGRIVVLDEHGTYYNLYLLSHMLSTLFNEDRVLYINVLVVLEWIITILAWKILLKYYKIHEIGTSFTILALLSPYIAGTTMRSAAVLQIILFILLMNKLTEGIKEKYMNAPSLLILFIVSTYIAMDGVPIRLISIITLLPMFFLIVLKIRRSDLQKTILFIIITVMLLMLITTIYDIFSIKYIIRYKKYASTFIEYALRFLFGERILIHEPLGLSKTALRFSYPLSIVLTPIRFAITLSYIIYMMYMTFLSIKCIFGEKSSIILRSISIAYLIFIILSGTGYIAQYLATRPFDYFVVLQPRFLPLVLALLHVLSSQNPEEKPLACPSKAVSAAISGLTFVSLMAVMMLSYLNNDTLSAIVPQEVLSPLSHSGYSYDTCTTLLFLQKYGTKTSIVVNVNKRTLCFLFSYISEGQLCTEMEFNRDINIIYESLSYVISLD